MGHPKDNIQFGIPLPSADGKYRSRYPDGDWPGIPASAVGAGITRPASSPVGLAVGAAIAAAAGKTDTAAAPLGAGAGAGSAVGSGSTATTAAPAASASFGGQAGLQFPSNDTTNSDVRLNWLGANLLPRTSHTAIIKARYSQQTGYYAMIWHCQNDGFFNFGGNYEYGTHPYPVRSGFTIDNDTGQVIYDYTPAEQTDHRYEIAGLVGHDYLASPNQAHGAPLQVQKNVDVVHIRTCEVIGSTLRHTFWPDAINNPSFKIQQDIPLASLNTPSTQAFVIGCSPWTSSNFAATGAGATNNECPNAIIRGIKLFSQPLSFANALAEAQSGTNAPVTSAGIASVFYMNENPTPTDIADKSGAGHTPVWANANRPALWTAASGAMGAGATASASAPTASASGGGGGGGSLVHGSSFTVSGSGFGAKQKSSPTIWDSGQAGANVLDPRWAGGLPNACTNAVHNIKNRATPFSGNGQATPINPAHSRTSVIMGGSHAFPGSYNQGWNVMPYTSFQRPAGTAYYSTWVFYYRCNSGWIFEPNPEIQDGSHDNNFKTYDVCPGNEPYNPLNANFYMEFYGEGDRIGSNTQTDGQYNLNDDGGFSPATALVTDGKTSLNDPDVNGHSHYWNGNHLNPFNDSLGINGWKKVIMEIKWNSSQTATDGYFKVFEVQPGVGVRTMIDYRGRTDGYAGTQRSESIGGFARQSGSRVPGGENWRYFHDVFHDRDTGDGWFALTNSATFSDSTIVEPQDYSSWSATSVNLRCNGGALPAGTVHLHFRSHALGHQYLGTRILA